MGLQQLATMLVYVRDDGVAPTHGCETGTCEYTDRNHQLSHRVKDAEDDLSQSMFAGSAGGRPTTESVNPVVDRDAVLPTHMRPPRRHERVWYRGTTLATVLTVHVDEDPPYYTILQDDGLERQTVLRFLQPAGDPRLNPTTTIPMARAVTERVSAKGAHRKAVVAVAPQSTETAEVTSSDGASSERDFF